jgi:YHS domain-containing protein
MKKKSFVILNLILLSFAVLTGVMAKEGKKQKICPVMGGKINKKIYIDYKGRRIYFCGRGCPKMFKKNPKKYLKSMAISDDWQDKIEPIKIKAGNRIITISGRQAIDYHLKSCRLCIGAGIGYKLSQAAIKALTKKGEIPKRSDFEIVLGVPSNLCPSDLVNFIFKPDKKDISYDTSLSLKMGKALPQVYMFKRKSTGKKIKLILKDSAVPQEFWDIMFNRREVKDAIKKTAGYQKFIPKRLFLSKVEDVFEIKEMRK